MNDMPRIGEYWYVNIDSNVTLEKIVGYCYVTERAITKFKGVYTTVDMKCFRYRWRPNWFWKLLGYH